MYKSPLFALGFLWQRLGLHKGLTILLNLFLEVVMMDRHQWLVFVLLPLVWSIALRQVDGARLLQDAARTSQKSTWPWFSILSPIGQPLLSGPNLPNLFNFTPPSPPPPPPSPPPFSFPKFSLPPFPTPKFPSIPPISQPLFSFPPLSQPKPTLPSVPPPPGWGLSLPPFPQPTLPKLPAWDPSSPPLPSLPSFPWNTQTPPPPSTPSFPWDRPSPSPPMPTIPTTPSFPWNTPSPPALTFPTIPTIPTNPTIPKTPSFPWNTPSPPAPTIPTFPTIPTIPTNPTIPKTPSFPWNTPSPPASTIPTFPTIPTIPTNPNIPKTPSFPWNTPSPPALTIPTIPTTPSFPWNTPSPPAIPSFPWPSSPPPTVPSLPWLTTPAPPAVVGSTLPPFGIPPGGPLFPNGIQFTFSNFTNTWLPEAGVKVTWASTISVELSLQLLAQAILKPITLIIQQFDSTGPGSWGWKNGLPDSKLSADVGATCTTLGKDEFPEKGLIVVQTPIDNTVDTAVTWFTVLFNGWSKDTPFNATLDHTPGTFGGFVTNATSPNLKTFCSHPGALNRVASKQGLQYVLN